MEKYDGRDALGRSIIVGLAASNKTDRLHHEGCRQVVCSLLMTRLELSLLKYG
jgi:hypothetical protein